MTSKIMIVDSHAHIGTSHKRYPLYIKTLEQMVETMDKFSIEKAVVSSIKGFQYDFKEGNLEVKAAMELYPDRFIPFCVVHPRHWGDAEEELERCVKDWGFKGLKLHPVDQFFAADCLSVRRLLEVVEDLGIPVAIHSSMDDFAHPNRIGNLAEQFPKITFLMVHLGKMLYWTDSVEVAESYPNVILDTTDCAPVDNIVERLVDAVGAKRVVAGTNLPISYPGPNITKVTHTKISENDKRLILRENILRIIKGI